MNSLSQRVEMLYEEHLQGELTEEQQERLHNIFKPFMTDELKAKTEAIVGKIGPAPSGIENKQARRKWLQTLFNEGQENSTV